MGNETSLLFWRIVLWGSPVIAAIFVFIANYKINQIETDKKEKEKQIIEAKRNGDIHINGNTGNISINNTNTSRNIKSSEISSIDKEHKKEKSMEEKKSGDTYNVSSYGQSGGITTGKFELHVPKQEQADEIDIPLNDNYQIKVDQATKRIEFHPKVGKWEKPFIAVPYQEKAVFASFGGKELMLTDVQEGDFSIDGVKFYAHSSGRVSNNAKPATGSFYYYMIFNEFPSYLIFGNYEKIAYKYVPSTGITTLY